MGNGIWLAVIGAGLIVLSIAAVYRLGGKKRCVWYICALLLLAGAGSIQHMVQVQELPRSFPTIEAAAEYFCQNDPLGIEPLGIVESDASGLIVYKDESHSINYRIALKADGKYSIGAESTDSTLNLGIAKTASGDLFYTVMLIECPQTKERYVSVFGTSVTSDMSIISITDSMNSEFAAASETTYLADGGSVSFGCAFAALKGGSPEPYEIAIVNSSGTARGAYSQIMTRQISP